MSGFKYSQSKKIIISSLREKRKKRRIFFIIGFFCFIILLKYFFIFSPVFRINKAEVRGEKTLLKEDIFLFTDEFLSGRFYNIFPKNNIFIFSSVSFLKELQKKFPIIKNVEISKRIPNKFEIFIIEREPMGIWCSSITPETVDEKFVLRENESCFYIDSDGVIFTEAPISSGGLILNLKDFGGKKVRIGDKVLNEDLLKIILILKESLYGNLNIKITEFWIYPEGSSKLEALTSESWSIIFDSRVDLSKSLIKLGSILNEEIKENRPNLEYVDLRIGNKVYYKYKNGL